MLHAFIVLLYAMTAGFTLSGIAASLYRMASHSAKMEQGSMIYYATLVVAGPMVLLENAANAWRSRDCTLLTFWLAAAIVGYWSFALGLLIIELALAV